MFYKSSNFKYRLKRLLFLVFGWVIAGIYIHSIIYVSIVLGHGKIDETYSGAMLRSLIEIFFAGSILAVFEVFYFTDRFKKRSFIFAVLTKTMFYISGMTFLVFLINMFYFLRQEQFTLDNIKYFSGNFIENIGFVLLTNFLPWGPVFIISTIFLQVSDKYGQGVFLKFFSGKYHKPKEENRIFMFLDIKSSTSIAEALGNVKYFELINDFFYVITDSILENGGEIYQYVGDEIIISWELRNGKGNTNCINCFFDIQDAIKGNRGIFESKYGLVPTFKAGMHYGNVTVGEIGVIKKEIIFTGDVLNTTSRIQELCNKYNQRLIVSSDLINLIEISGNFLINEIGMLNLRGRAAPIVLHSIERKSKE